MVVVVELLAGFMQSFLPARLLVSFLMVILFHLHVNSTHCVFISALLHCGASGSVLGVPRRAFHP